MLLYIGLDVLSADCLFDIATSGASAVSALYASPRANRMWKPASVVAVYLFNPFTLLACLGRPTTTFTTFFTLLSVKHACRAKVTTAAFALAMASYISLHPMLLLPPVGLLCYDQLCVQLAGAATKTDEGVSGKGKTVKIAFNHDLLPSLFPFGVVFATTFALTAGLLLVLSRLLLPSWSFVESVYMTPLTLPDLTPNPGLWWYFFIEMFDAFREFFLGVFWLHMLSYSVPFCLRFQKQPLAAVVLMMGVNAVFQPYANVGDVGSWIGTLCLLGHVFERKSARFTVNANTNTASSMLDASIHVPGADSIAVRIIAWPSVPPPLDLCWVRQCELLLRHYIGMELGASHLAHGYRVCSPAGRMGERETRREG